ncbi:MAG: TOBE domain-containing protein, partial [Roseovarius sp.]
VTGLPSRHGGRITLGVRPEDCTVGGTNPQVTGNVYGVEPTGDLTYLTVKAGDKLIEVKARRDYRAELNTPETVSFDPPRIYLFDGDTGLRLR